MVEESGSPHEARKQEGAWGKKHSAKIQPWQPASFNWAPLLYTSASLQKHPNVTPSTDYLIDEGRAPLWSGPLQGPALNMMASFKAYRLAYRLM